MSNDIYENLKKDGAEIKEYNGYYVSSNGNVYNKRGKELKPSTNSKGYKFLSFSNNGKTKNEMLHRVLAKCFIPNPNNYPQINHKDGDKANNNLDNLEWCTPSQNVQHAWDNGLAIIPDKPVICLNTGIVYPSARNAADSLNFHSPSAITACCLGKRKSAYKGCIWRYYQPTELVKKLRNAGFLKYPADNSIDGYLGFLSLVMQWLRLDKNIHINIDFFLFNGETELWWVFEIRNIHDGSTYDIYGENKWKSFNEAALAGIEYVIDNLI